MRHRHPCSGLWVKGDFGRYDDNPSAVDCDVVCVCNVKDPQHVEPDGEPDPWDPCDCPDCRPTWRAHWLERVQ